MSTLPENSFKRVLAGVALVVGTMIVPAHDLPAQHVTLARMGITPPATQPAACESVSHCRIEAGSELPATATNHFRPVATVLGGLVGAVYGGMSYIAAGEAGDELLSFSNHRFPKAIAIGAAVGLLIDLTRHVASERTAAMPQ